jgi:hypothetical protein
MTLCRTLDEVIAAGREQGKKDGPLSQAAADQVAVILQSVHEPRSAA